ncbi:MAG: SWF/SNF helicase family protein, partial [Lachnospiraceae bacterium]|nr:SWF/SNF helicase family protein [Lachnospiraceae bacterium]
GLCFDGYTGGSAKREMCMDLLQSLADGGHKTLLFSQFTTMLELIEKDLDKAGLKYYKITGTTPKEQRLKLVNTFNDDDTPVFLISLKAGGTGLNLTGADSVVHYDPWWNVSAENQATDRAHRIGQKSIVTVYKLIIKGSIEEKIVKLQEEKAKLAEDVLSAEGISSSSLNRDELMELLV